MEAICRGGGRPGQFRTRHNGGLYKGRRIRNTNSWREKIRYNAMFKAVRIHGLCESRNSAKTIEHDISTNSEQGDFARRKQLSGSSDLARRVTGGWRSVQTQPIGQRD